MDSYKSSLEALANHSKALPAARNEAIKSFETVVSVFDGSQEIKDFVNQHYTGFVNDSGFDII